jgi:hypothetical protein
MTHQSCFDERSYNFYTEVNFLFTTTVCLIWARVLPILSGKIFLTFHFDISFE